MGMVKILMKLRNYFVDFEFGILDNKEQAPCPTCQKRVDYREDPQNKQLWFCMECGGEVNARPALWPVEAVNKNLKYLQAQNADKRHIFIRPAFDQEPYFMMVDDLNSRQLEAHKDASGKFRAGRLVVMSSTGNYQVWIKSSRALSNEEKLYWLKKMNSDPGAAPRHRWGRSPGFRNHKYADGPLARLVWVDWANLAEIPIPPGFENSNPGQPKKAPVTPARSTRENVNLGDLVSRADFDTGDESQTDFRYIMSLIRRGVPDHEIINRVLNERTNWQKHRGHEKRYVEVSIKKAHSVARV